MQYIGDAKSGRFVGKDQYVTHSLLAYTKEFIYDRFGNRYFENLNELEELPGKLIPRSSQFTTAMPVQVVTDGWIMLKCDDLVQLVAPYGLMRSLISIARIQCYSSPP